MAKDQISKVGGKLGPGITNNPGWSSDLNYHNTTRNDKASKPTKEERASGKPENKKSDGLFEKGTWSGSAKARGQKMAPGKGETGLFGNGSGLRQ